MGWFKRLTGILRRERLEQDLDDELQFHFEMKVRENLQAGMTPAQARRAAYLAFGGVEEKKEACRDADRLRLIEDLGRDLRFGVRTLRSNPAFAAMALLSLALGIGANTLVFSVVNALVLRPLPVEQPDRLVFLESTRYGPSHSFPNYKDLRDRNQTFTGLVGYRPAPMELGSGRGPVRIWGYLATGNYFDVLGVQPVLGRFFHQADDRRPGASPYAVLSYGAWQSRFGGDPEIIGKVIRINRHPYTVLGVAPPGFHGTELFYWPEVWVPMMMEPQIEVGNPWLEKRGTWNTWVIGRLKPGVAPAQALANLNTIGSELAREYPQENEGLQFKLARPGLVGDVIGGPARAFALGVLGLAALVLLAACVNLVGLLTARAADRQREFAIRLSIGAGRTRLLRQMLTETLLLSAVGGGLGYGLAVVLAHALSGWRAPLDFPLQFNVDPDWRVFCFAWAISLFSGVLFGVAPAWRASRRDPNAALKGTSCQGSVGRLSLRDVLVVVQVALCFVLVSGCLLSLQGLERALKMNLGFVPEHLAVASFDLGMAGYSKEKGQALQRRLLEKVGRLPGVQSAAYSDSLPLSLSQSHTSVYPIDRPNLRPSDRINATYYQVSPGFFSTLGTRLLAGRDFSWHDVAGSPPVAIVNRTFADRVLASGDPVGKRFRDGFSGPLVEVVGVVEDGKYEGISESAKPVVFWPMLQVYNATTTLEVRSRLPAATMVAELRRAIEQLDPQLPVYGSGSLEEMLALAFFPNRAAALALSAFGLLAAMLAVTGIYGLVAYAVSRRVPEIGIRMALGARPSQVLRLVLGKMMVLLAGGSALGLLLALAAGRVMASVVYLASARDPLLLAAVLGPMLLMGLLSGWLPARRALRIEPVKALHYE